MAGAEFIPSNELESLRELTAQANEVSTGIDPALVRDFVLVKRKIEAINTELSLLNKKYDAMQATLMNSMLACATKSIKTDEQVLISVRVTPYFSADEQDKRKFAREFNREDLLTINSQKFSSEIKEMRERGEGIPAYVKEYQRKGLSVRGI